MKYISLKTIKILTRKFGTGGKSRINQTIWNIPENPEILFFLEHTQKYVSSHKSPQILEKRFNKYFFIIDM